ncbi:MAG: hypothetical protein WCX95_00815 [Candidatus Gracilibacteria bacterium]
MRPHILENSTIEVAKSHIGKGGEHIVYKTTDGYNVVKVERGIVSGWQTKGEDFVIASEEAMEREGVPRLPSVILVHPNIVVQNERDPAHPRKDKILQPDVAQMFPKIKEYDSLTLRWPQLKDPQIQAQIIELCRKAENIFKKDKFGVDPIGLAALGDNLQGLGKTILEMIFEKMPQSPELVREFIRMYLAAGIPGQMRNLLVAKEDKFLEGDAAKPYNNTGERIQITEKGKIILADTGVHDLRPTTHPASIIPAIREAGIMNVLRRIPAQQLTFPAHYLMWGSIIELLTHANPELKDRTDLPFTHGDNPLEQAQRNIARRVSRAMVEMMIPQFEKHGTSQTQTQV